MADHVAVTPLGKPEPVVSIPVAPVVAIVISVKAVFTTSDGVVDGAAADLVTQVTVIVPVALAVPQPPVKGIV